MGYELTLRTVVALVLVVVISMLWAEYAIVRTVDKDGAFTSPFGEKLYECAPHSRRWTPGGGIRGNS